MSSPLGWIGEQRRVVTAGVILRYGGRYVFQLGPRRSANALVVYRLGGHLEAGESAEQCAIREVAEEASAQCTIQNASTTFRYWHGQADQLEATEWPGPGPAPLLVGWDRDSAGARSRSL